MTRARPGGRLISILVHAAIVQVLTFAVRPTLSYAVLDAGGTPALLGVVAAAFAVPALLMALPAGHAVDRIGERPALILGSVTLLMACSTALWGAESITLLVLATVLLGGGHLMSVVGNQAMIANVPGERSLDSRFGLYAFAASFGQTAGPLLLMLPGGTAAVPPIDLVFASCAAISVALVILSLTMRSSARSGASEQGGLGRTAWALLRERGVPQALVASAIVLASIDLFVAYAPALGHERHFTAEIVSVMLVIRSGMSMFSRLFLTQLIRVCGRRPLLVGTVLLSAITLGAMVMPLTELWVIVLSAVYGFAVGVCQPITMAWVSELAAPGTRGLAMSLRVASNRVGQIALPAILGTVAVAAGAGGVLAVTGLSLLGSAWAGMAVGRHRPPRSEAD